MQNNDPQTIWQNQNTEEIKVSPAYFKLKADQQRTKNHWMAIANDIVFLAVIPFLGFIFMKTPNITSRAGLALLVAGSLGVIYLRHTRLWPESQASGTPPGSGLEAYRRELLRWQTDQRNVWRMLAPLLPGAIVFAASGVPSLIHAASANPAVLMNGLPFCILLAVWLVLVPVVRRRRVKAIQQELDALGS
jgi:hypothetical protein